MRKSLVLVVLLAACGGDGVRHLPDGPPAPDAAADASNAAPVSLRILVDGQPIAGHDVYFQAANGALIAKVATSTAGIASAVMAAGGFVTTVDPFPTKGAVADIRTFAGVKPDDQLHLHSTTTAPISLTFTAPSEATASVYQIYSSCSSMQTIPGGGGSGSLPSGTISLAGCGGIADFLVQTLDGNGLPSRYLFKPGVTVADQGTVNLSSEVYQSPVPTVAFNWTGVPAAYSSIVFRNTLASAHGPIFDQLLSADVSAGGAMMTVSRPSVTAGVSITESHPSPTSGVGQQFVTDWAPAGSSATIPLAGVLLGTYTAAPALDLPTRTVTWTAGAGVIPDLVVGTVTASRTVATSTTTWHWQIAMPFGATTFTLPVLPTGIDQYNFVAGDTATVYELVTAKVPGGYDAVRAEILSSDGPSTFVVGPTGRIVFETLANQTPQ